MNGSTIRNEQHDIIVVDDTLFNLQLLTNILTAQGYRVRPASSAILALQSVNVKIPDLILLDVKMPDIGGYEICRRLKANERTRNIPVIFISALDEVTDKVEGFRVGGVDYITKPFNKDEVLARVRTHLQLGALTENLEQKVQDRTQELLNTNAQLQHEVNIRKETEEALCKMNRAYKAISDCKQALIYTSDVMLFLKKICDIIVKDCEYSLVCIGLVEQNETENIRIVAHSEYTEGNSDNKTITWPDIENGRNPVSQAVKERRAVVNTDILTIADFNPWRDESYKCGYASFAAIPLFTSEGAAIGVLNVYASESDAFRSDEIDLLSELAADVTYGIISLRMSDERRRIEKELQISEQQYRTLVSNIPGVVYRCYYDEHWTMHFISKNIEELTGYPASYFINNRVKSYKSIIRKEDRSMVAQNVKEAVKNRRPYIIEYQIVTANGGTRWVYEKGQGIYDQENQLVYLDGVIFDNTERKQAEEELRQFQKMDSVGHLAGGIAHDFNNMLTSIMGSATLLVTKISKDSLLIKYVNSILQATDRAAELTKKLLDFSRKNTLVKETLDVHGIVKETLDILVRSVEPHIQIINRNNAVTAISYCNRTSIQNVILNLCVNARDAMPEGGMLNVSTSNRYLDETYCSRSPFSIKPGWFVEIAVSDTGCGMDQETIRHVFEPFYTTKEVGRGTGLGLATVYGTVVEHHGEIHVHSKLHVGTTFRLCLPVTDNVAVVQSKDREDIVYTTDAECILVIDDEEMVLSVTRALLVDIGYRIITAPDGEAGITIYREKQKEIALVLIDMIMPKMNGIDTFHALKRINPEVPIILSSGFGVRESITQLFNEGLCEYIQKPYNIATLSKKMAKALGKDK